MKKKFLLALSLLSSFLFPACGNNPQGEQEFKSVYFDSINVTYDGNEHILGEVRGAPSGTGIVYSGRESFINAGTYKATATLSKENYKSKTLEATLSILPAEFKDVSYNSVTVTFNEIDHYNDIQVVGDLPAGTSVVQTVTNEEGTIVENATYPGVYHYKATLTNDNYNTICLSASLTIEAAQFTNATFKSKVVPYSGNKYMLGEVTGIPENTSIFYRDRFSHSDVGSYPAYAVLFKPGYEVKVLEAFLTITPTDFPTPGDINYRPKSVAYDGGDHIDDIEIAGLPEEATLSKRTVRNEEGDIVTEAIDTGVYTYTAEITFKNYNPLILTSSLTIRNYMPVYVTGENTIYFSNWKDNRSLYSLDNAGTFARVDSSPVKNFKRFLHTNTMLYNANTGLMNSIKAIDGNSFDFIYTDGEITDFVKKGGDIYYYSKKSTTPGVSGIYKVDLTKTSEEEIVTKVCNEEADNLYLHGNDLYYINSENGSIRKFDTTTPAAVVTDVVKDAKVNEFFISNTGKLYLSVNESTNHYIGYISLDSTNDITKIAENKAGEFLKLIENKIYFNYSPAYGATDYSECGIWSIDTIDSQHTQTHVITNEGIDGFDLTSASNIVYTDRNNPNSLYRYDSTTSTKTDLLTDFVMPDTIPTKEKGKTIFHNGKLYYLNMHANRSLWSYDENNKKNIQLSSGSVTDFAISGGSIFINQPTTTNNNDIYCASVSGTSEARNINRNDLREMTLDAGYIYGTSYVNDNPTGIARMKTDGTLFNKFSNVTSATDYVIRPSQQQIEGKFMFINRYSGKDVGDIETIDLDDITDTSTGLTSTKFRPDVIKNVKQFLLEGNDIHFLYDGNDGNYIKLTFFSSGGVYIKMGEEVPIRAYEFSFDANYYYFYSYGDNDAGFYRIGRHAESEFSYVKLLDYESKYFGSCFAWSGPRLYFLNYRPELGLGNAHTYCLDVNQKTIEQIDY